MPLVSECRIRVSFRTATVQGLSTRWAKACLGNGPVGVFGVMARNPIAPLEPLPSTRCTVLPLKQAVPLPENVPLEQGACLGIPGITAHRAVHVAGPVEGRTVLVQGGAGAVGACAVQLCIKAERASSPRAAPNATKKSHREQGQMRFCLQVKTWSNVSAHWLPMEFITSSKWLSGRTSKATWSYWPRTARSRPTQPMLRGRRFRSGNLCLLTPESSLSAATMFPLTLRSVLLARSIRHSRQGGKDSRLPRLSPWIRSRALMNSWNTL